MLCLVGTGFWASYRSRNAPPLLAGQPDLTTAEPKELPVIFELPSFQLLDQNNKPVTDHDLNGQPFVGCFVFTHCAGPCPMMYMKLSEMQKDLIDAGARSVCFTVDPDRDTPDVIKAKANELKADDAHWTFITGEKSAVDKLLKEMLQPRPTGAGENPLMHDTKFYLFDAQGRCRGRYSSSDDDDLKSLKRDAATLAAQAKAHGGKPS
jgi:cytochrome oxidase Cu insertion factor (SCO1/SenC/PrrC family)